ncbi:BRO-N domain-containing protein [Arcanobacterium haemolyticum]
MKTNIVPFNFEGNTVRAFELDGNAWFVAKDVAIALGYKDPTNAIKQHTRGVVKRHPIQDALGRMQEVRIINEPDLYRLIVSSKRPDAQEFERKVFEEVLPAVRKQGYYAAPVKDQEHLDAAFLRQQQMRMELLQSARGLIDPKHLEAKARIELARGLGELPQLPAADRPLYAKDFLASKNLSTKRLKSISSVFGKRLKAAYILEHGTEPGKYPLNLANGQTRDVNAYTERDRDLMETVWNTYYAQKAA